ncbi:MAG: contact-dependent growth inhibition system immunity protein [Smithellaceae bacterium]
MIFRLLKKKAKIKEAGAALYQRPNGFFLCVENKTISGVWKTVEPCMVVPIETSKESLGEAIRAALLKSKVNVENDTNFKGGFDFVLKQAKVRSHKQFMNGCKLCSITQKGTTLTYYPWINEGKGFTGFPSAGELNVTCDLSCSDEELGARAHECLNRSR